MKPQWYSSPIDLPEGSSGNMTITHKIVTGSTPIISLREWYTRGMKGRPCSAQLDNPLRYHELSEAGVGVWMTDLPSELNQAYEALHAMPPRGRVLVGGLGLGILPKLLTLQAQVDQVTVVERSPDVIRLCADRANYHVVRSDIADYLRICTQFDCYYLDTWQGTNESCWWDQVIPLRRVIANRFGRKPVWCWAENIMLGQIRRAATTQAGKHWHYRALPENASASTIVRFVSNVGLPAWEKRYGQLCSALSRVRGEAVAR